MDKFQRFQHSNHFYSLVMIIYMHLWTQISVSYRWNLPFYATEKPNQEVGVWRFLRDDAILWEKNGSKRALSNFVQARTAHGNRSKLLYTTGFTRKTSLMLPWHIYAEMSFSMCISWLKMAKINHEFSRGIFSRMQAGNLKINIRKNGLIIALRMTKQSKAIVC